MFTDATARRAIAAMQSEITDLKALVAASNEQMAALARDVARLRERDDGQDGALSELSERIDAVTKRQAGAAREQSDRLARIERISDQQQRDLGRLDIEADQLRRQAAVDNREMRGNYAALASVVPRDEPAIS